VSTPAFGLNPASGCVRLKEVGRQSARETLNLLTAFRAANQTLNGRQIEGEKGGSIGDRTEYNTR